MEENKKKQKKRLSPVLILIVVICLGVLGFSGYKILSVQLNYKQARDEYAALRSYTKMEAQDMSGTGNGTGEQEDPSTETSKRTSSESDKQTHGSQVMSKKHVKAPISVDHAALKANNEDYIGWLYIPALDLSYPIMKHEGEEEYYLHRTYDGSYLFAGCLFVNGEASRDFSDPHTLIYGHNMLDGSMFGTLRRLYDSELYREDPYFWVLTPGGNYAYRMFSMYVCLDNSDTYTIFSGHGEVVVDYIDAMKERSFVDLGDIDYDIDSKVVTLSTCVQAEGSERFVVQGVRES